MKRVAAIHDLSGFGKSSLTVVIPLMSSMGIQVCPVPTAVLSTQTDGFSGYSFTDLTDNMKRHLSHWKSLDLSFDSVYTGYLGDEKQVDIISAFISEQKDKNAVILIDPVLGDNGALYSGIQEGMIGVMREFIARANIITPNFTEANYLLGMESCELSNTSRSEDYVRKFSALTDANVIVTSVNIAGSYYNICFDREIDEVFNIEFEKQEISYPGSGDAFASLLLAKLLKTGDFTIASFFATNRTSRMIKEAQKHGSVIREGLPVELFLNSLENDDII